MSTGQNPNEKRFVNFNDHRAEDEKFWQHHQHHERDAQLNNHSGGIEPMQYQRDGSGTRGRGGHSGVTRGNYQGQQPREQTQRLPVNDSAEEVVSKLSKGKWWHDSSDLSCCCKTVDCGAIQEIPFCQGCGQHHHGREFCYKRKDSRVLAIGVRTGKVNRLFSHWEDHTLVPQRMPTLTSNQGSHHHHQDMSSST